MIFDVRQNFLLYISVLILSTDFYPFFQETITLQIFYRRQEKNDSDSP